MREDEFQQTVMQELQEQEEREPKPFSREWLGKFEELSKELKQIAEKGKCHKKPF